MATSGMYAKSFAAYKMKTKYVVFICALLELNTCNNEKKSMQVL